MCKKHPKYKAIKVPKCDCDDCWKMYMVQHGRDKAMKAYFTSIRKKELTK